MGEKILEYLIKIIDFIFSREVGIELIKIAFTALVGFITFKIYQMYRNKKDNSKLYIQMIKLKREIIMNRDILGEIINNHEIYHSLEILFKGENSDGLYDLYKLVASLNNYSRQDSIYENGEFVDIKYVYTEKPYEAIECLEYERNQVESEGEEYQCQLKAINAEIEKYENESIFDLLIEIEKRIKLIDIEGHELCDSVGYLSTEIQKFNSKDLANRRKNLDEFCSKLLEGNNSFSDSLTQFNNYKELSRSLFKSKVYKKIEFEIWQQQDMDLLGVYSADDYLILEEYYHKNRNIEIDNGDLEKANVLYKEMKIIYDRIERINNVLKKTLNKTNWIFGKI